jgi:hypothetical protein
VERQIVLLALPGHDHVVANFSTDSKVVAVTRIYEEGSEVVTRRSGATLTSRVERRDSP